MTTSTANYLAEKADNGEAAEYSISIAAELLRLNEVNADLLEALQAMFDESTTRQSIELDIWSDAQYAARAAIAKATGGAT